MVYPFGGHVKLGGRLYKRRGGKVVVPGENGDSLLPLDFCREAVDKGFRIEAFLPMPHPWRGRRSLPMSHPWRGGSGFAISPFPPPDPPVSVGESSPGYSLDAPTVPDAVRFRMRLRFQESCGQPLLSWWFLVVH